MKIRPIFFLVHVFTITLVFSQTKDSQLPAKPISHVFYAVGNLGVLTKNQSNLILNAISKDVGQTSDKSSILFLGNNTAAKGFVKDDAEMIETIESQAKILADFSGNIFYIPGHLDWKTGLHGLKNQKEALISIWNNKDVFQPKNGCPLVKLNINATLDLLILDSQWALSDWNKIPNINDKCSIKNKEEFYVEVEHEIVKSQGKSVLIAAYHPIASRGKFGNNYSFGINPQSLNNSFYKEYRDRLLTIARQFKNVTLLGGHEESLQFLRQKNIPIIVSGASIKTTKPKKGRTGEFYYPNLGYTKIINFEDGSIWVSFYGTTNNFKAPLFLKELIKPDMVATQPNYDEYSLPKYVSKSIYNPEELDRSGVFKTLWGQHYRKDYGTKVKLQVALLDTLYEGLKPIRKGGGHQTNSLRLETSDGREFVMRAAKKSALRFIQYFLFKTEYLNPDLEDIYFIQLLQDYWTTANPFASLTVGDLADALDIYHANPEIFYVPKQSALGIYNEGYGNKIYFIEERITDDHNEVASLGLSDKIESTLDLLDELRRKDKIEINESLYIRTRLFDNVIGDWDRHADQWRWSVRKQDNGIKMYEPIPRDRDQAFSDFDGFMLGALTLLTPPLRFMQRYDETYNHTKWFNDAGDDLDMALLKNHQIDDWLREADFIENNLNEEVIDKAFERFPEEINQDKVDRIKSAMLGRIKNIKKNAENLHDFLKSNVLITGTDKDDHFVITRKPGGITNVKIYRISKGNKGIKFWDVDYNSNVTKELWVYGLDDKDVFEVKGRGDKFLRIKIIGGQNNDTYRIENSKKVRVFDQKSKPNTFEARTRKTLTDDYDLNTYNYKKNRRDLSQFVPLIEFNPDDGLGLGLSYAYTKNSLWKNPFTQNHNLSLKYFSSTSGIEFEYNGEFANVFDKANLGIETRYSSPNYATNFFGLGNQTPNFDDDLDFDFNRVRIEQFKITPSLIFRGYHGSKIDLKVGYEYNKVEQTENRFIETATINQEVFSGQSFGSVEATYEYQNFDNETNPKSGLGIGLRGGYKLNLKEDRSFPYIIPELRLTTKIDSKGILVYATKLKAHFNLSNDFEFYQAASLGDGDGLRGFREERFSGKSSFYHNSDIRLSLGKIRNSILPIWFGAYGGFDYGRVWIPAEESNVLHTSTGGGLYFNLAGFTTANIAYFSSKDGGRINIRFSLAF